MCIANELSCEVASALLAGAAPTKDGGAAELARVALLCHETLRSLERDGRRRKLRRPAADAARASASGPSPA